VAKEEFDLDKFEKENPDEFEIVADLLSKRKSAKDLGPGRRGEKPEPDDETGGDPYIERAVAAVIEKTVTPHLAKIDALEKDLTERRAKDEETRKRGEIDRFLGEVDGKVKAEAALTGDGLGVFFRGGLVHLANEEFGGDMEKALGAVKERMGKRDQGRIEEFVSKKNPATGVLETGGGAPAPKPGADRGFESGGFREGLRAALESARKKSPA
jgi:hypothetical protein